MDLFLLLQAHYQIYEVGLFCQQKCIDSFRNDKKHSSRDLIPAIASLLERNNYALKDITALGVNQGPAPFTSLRVIITTANGLAFATGIPLIGINSLEALLNENSTPQWPYTVALLNAFNNDVYFGIQSPEGLEIGCQNNLTFLTALQNRFKNKEIRFLGSGTLLLHHEIRSLFGTHASIPEPCAESCSLQQLGLMTAQAFAKKELHQEQLLPLYLKNMRYAIQV